MAIVWQTDFESGTPATIFDTVVGAANVTIDAPSAKNGTKGLRVDISAAAYGSRTVNTDIVVARFYVKLDAVGGATERFFSASDGTHAMALIVDGAGLLNYRFQTTNKTTGITLAANTWYLIDVRFVRTGTTVAADIMVDGVAGTSQSNAITSLTTFTLVLWGAAAAGVSVFHFDDLAYSVTSADYPLGSPSFTQTLQPTGIASAQAFGSPTLVPGPATVQPTGIASAEASGAPTILATITVSPGGIASAEAFGNPTVIGAFVVQPVGIASAQAFGSPTLTPGSTSVAPTAIVSAEALGVPVIKPTITSSPTGIATAETFGNPTLKQITYMQPTGIASAQALGNPTLVPGAVVLSPVGIASAGAVGVPYIIPPSYVWVQKWQKAFGDMILASQGYVKLVKTHGSIKVLPQGSSEVSRS